MGLSIKDRVIQTLGQDNSDYLDDINEVQELFSSSIWSSFKLLPQELLLAHCDEPKDPTTLTTSESTSGDIGVDNHIVLLAMMYSANHKMSGNTIQTANYVIKPCKEISYANSFKALDGNSIYFATINSPVYWIENVGGVAKIKTAPAYAAYDYDSENVGGFMPNGKITLRVFFVERRDMEVADLTETDIFINKTANKKLPPEAEGFVIKNIALSILMEKLSNASIQDEDTEVAALLQNQIKLLNEDIAAELEALKTNWTNE